VDFEESNTIMEANASHFIMKLIRGLEKCRKNAPFMLWFKMYSEKKNIHEVYNKKKNECIDNGIKTTAFEDIIKINMEVGWSLKKLENGYASIETVLPFNFKNISTSLLEIIQNIKYDDIKHSDI